MICENCGENLDDTFYECKGCFTQLCDNCVNVCKHCGDEFCDGCYPEHKRSCK